MNRIHQTIVLRSAMHYGKRVPPAPFGKLLHEIPCAVQQSVRMAFGGRSTAKGRNPEWLKAASDIRLLDYSGEDETILHFEAPQLGEAAPSMYEQQEIWPTKPDATDTGFDLLADVICDVAQKNKDSDRFDRPLLRTLSRFNGGIQAAFQEILVTGHRHTSTDPGILDRAVIETAKSFSSSTPRPQQARIVGCLDMMRSSTQTFALKLDNGEEVRAVLVEGEMDAIKGYFEKRVMVLGKAVFRASGRLLRIDATDVRPASHEDKFFSQSPRPSRQPLNFRQLAREQQPKRGLASIMGKWPGDETDEEIEKALQEMS